MPSHSNFVDVFGLFTTTHTSPLCFSHPSVVRWLLVCQPPPELISLDEDGYGFHLPQGDSKSWKTLEQSCLQIIAVLHDFFKTEHPKAFIACSVPKASLFGYSKCHRTKEEALSTSLDAFLLLFACVSWIVFYCQCLPWLRHAKQRLFGYHRFVLLQVWSSSWTSRLLLVFDTASVSRSFLLSRLFDAAHRSSSKSPSFPFSNDSLH